MNENNNTITIRQPRTLFSHLDDVSLRSMYDEYVWFGLNENQRRDLLQETVNREAIANGNKYACTVVFSDMDCGTYGEQRGNVILMNRDIFVNDCMTEVYNGQTITYKLNDSNFLAYETVMHEHQHVLQDAITYGIVDADLQTKALFETNCFTTSDINGSRGSQYMLGKLDFSLYMLNPTEADAFRVSQSKANALVNEFNALYGEKQSNIAYTNRMKSEAFDVKIEQYKALYNNPNIEKEVANVLMNAHYQTNIPVDANIETIVHREMILSQNEIDNQYKPKEVSQMQDNKWADMHVSRDAYGSTLRNTVNSFYEHITNDPAVSQEQAIAETAQVSEGYLNAMEAFDVAQSEALSTGTSVDSVGIDSGSAVVSESGLSGGMDYGCDNSIGIE